MISTALAIGATLLIVKALYAYVLNKPRLMRLQPDATIAFVSIGVGLCFCAAWAYIALTAGAEYDAQMRGLFAALIYCLVGGIPIAIWQIGRSIGAFLDWLWRVTGQE